MSLYKLVKNLRPTKSTIHYQKYLSSLELLKKPIKDLSQKDVINLLSGLAAKRDYSKVEEIVSKLEKENLSPIVLNLISRTYFDSNNVEKAEEFLKFRKTAFDFYTKNDYLTELRGYQFNKKVEKFNKVYQEYTSKFGEDSVSFSFKLQLYTRLNDCETIMKLLERKDIVSVIHYEQIIHISSKINLDFSLKLLKDMLMKNLEPTIEIYNQILEGHFKQNKKYEGEAFFLNYSKDYQRPNQYTYQIMVIFYMTEQNFVKLDRILAEMKRSKIKMNSIIGTFVMKANALRGSFDVENSIENLKSQGLLPDQFFFSRVILDFVVLKRLDEAKKVYELMKKSNIKASNEIQELFKE